MIQVIEKALNILELLANEESREFPLGEIANTLNMDHGTCSNIIKTLSSRGYINQKGPRCGYKLGYMPYKLTNSAINNEELTKIARDEIDDLGRRLNETAILSCIKNDKRIVLYNTIPDRELIVRTNVDKSIYSANTGRVIIANYTPAHLEKCLIRLGLPSKDEWPEIHESDNPQGELVNKLATIRIVGYEIHHDSNGIVGVAAPIFKTGHVVGSVGVYMPKMRYIDEKAILAAVLDSAAEINRKIKLTEIINR